LEQFREGGLIYKGDKIWKLTQLLKHHAKTKMNYLMQLPKISPEQSGLTT
jgi:hypothetical protein